MAPAYSPTAHPDCSTQPKRKIVLTVTTAGIYLIASKVEVLKFVPLNQVGMQLQ